MGLGGSKNHGTPDAKSAGNTTDDWQQHLPLYERKRPELIEAYGQKMADNIVAALRTVYETKPEWPFAKYQVQQPTKDPNLVVIQLDLMAGPYGVIEDTIAQWEIRLRALKPPWKLSICQNGITLLPVGAAETAVAELRHINDTCTGEKDPADAGTVPDMLNRTFGLKPGADILQIKQDVEQSLGDDRLLFGTSTVRQRPLTAEDENGASAVEIQLKLKHGVLLDPKHVKNLAARVRTYGRLTVAKGGPLITITKFRRSDRRTAHRGRARRTIVM